IEFPPVEEIQRQCHELEALLDGEDDGDESGSAKRRDRPCPLCGRQFRLLANLRRHLRLRHALLHRQESPEQPPRKRSRPTGPAKKPGWAGASGEWRSAEVASHAELTAWRLSHEASVGCRYYVSSLRREGGGGEPGAVRYCVHSCSAGWRTRLACPARIIASRRPGGLAGYRIRYSLLHRHHPEHRPPARTRFSAGEASHVPDVRARALRSALLSTEEPDRLCDPRLARRLTREALRGHALGGQQPWQAVEDRLLAELAAGPASPLLLCQFRRSWCFRNRVRLGAGFRPSDGALGCALTLQAPSERQLLAQRLSSAEALVIDCVYESSDPEEISVLCLLLLDAEGRPQTGGWLLTDRVTETRVEDWLRCCVTAAADSPRSDSGCAFTGWLLLPPGLLGATAGARVFPRAAGCFAERLQLLRSWRRCLQARPDQWDVAALLLLELHAAAVQPQLGRASAALSEFARKFRRVSPELAARADRLARWPQLWADAAKPARLRWVEMRLHSNPGLLGLLPLHFAGRTRRPDRLLALVLEAADWRRSCCELDDDLDSHRESLAGDTATAPVTAAFRTDAPAIHSGPAWPDLADQFCPREIQAQLAGQPCLVAGSQLVRRVRSVCPERLCFRLCPSAACAGLCPHLYRCDCRPAGQTGFCRHVHRAHADLTARLLHTPAAEAVRRATVAEQPLLLPARPSDQLLVEAELGLSAEPHQQPHQLAAAASSATVPTHSAELQVWLPDAPLPPQPLISSDLSPRAQQLISLLLDDD
ncbi:hypothetical protein BOX15_Mlig023565g1, partial [Macrostomum lignano]